MASREKSMARTLCKGGDPQVCLCPTVSGRLRLHGQSLLQLPGDEAALAWSCRLMIPNEHSNVLQLEYIPPTSRISWCGAEEEPGVWCGVIKTAGDPSSAIASNVPLVCARLPETVNNPATCP